MTEYKHEWSASRRCIACAHPEEESRHTECPVRLRQALDEARAEAQALREAVREAQNTIGTSTLAYHILDRALASREGPKGGVG